MTKTRIRIQKYLPDLRNVYMTPYNVTFNPIK